MQPESQTRHSRALPELRFSFNLLYVGRFLLGMKASSIHELDAFDERIEAVRDELIATELLHEAATLAGNVLPAPNAQTPAQTDPT